MLKINLTKLFRLRGIEKPAVFLMRNGFTHAKAYKILNNNPSALKPSNLEKLCKILSCTPNDFLEWEPDKNEIIPETHPLNKLKPSETIIIREILKDVPADKIQEFKNGIELLKQNLKN